VQAVDTNVLMFAEIRSRPQHETASALVRRLAEGHLPWAIPWPCIYEFLRVITHPRVFHPPVPIATALADLKRILTAPTLVLLSETDHHAEIMARLLGESGATGNLVHDAHIAALCIEHGVSELLTGDRDFSRFPGLSTRDPFA